MNHRIFGMLMVPAALVAFAYPAHAFDECENNADCLDGFVCEEFGASTCEVPACPPGEECPDPPPCEPEVIHGCVPGLCVSDADCADGLRCLEVIYEACADVPAPEPCVEGEECPEPIPEEEPCEVTTEAYCLPPYLAPCTSDDQCGEGFECIAPEMCVCTDGEPIPEDDPLPGEDPVPPEEDDPNCSCEPADERHCVPQEVECGESSDCPTDWTCETIPTPVACTYDPETDEEICEEAPEEEAYCMPPHWEMGWGWGYDEASGSDGVSGLEAATGANDFRVSEPEDQNPDDPEESSGGCSTVPGSPAGASALLWALPLLISRLRRR